jgi:hypothetical protein
MTGLCSGDDWASAKVKASQRVSLAATKPMQNWNPESMMLLCILRTLSSLERRKNKMRVKVSSSRRILLS